MPVTPLRDILKPAFDARYGVPAINIVNDLTMEAVLAGAVEARSPVILQTSVKTVTVIAPVLYAMWKAMTAGHRGPDRPAPRPLPRPRGDHDLPRGGLELGPVRRVHAARRGEPAPDDRGRRRGPPLRRGRRGRDRVDHRVEDGVGSDAESHRQTLEISLAYLEATGVDCFAPADRQRARHVQARARPRLPARQRPRRGPSRTDRPARRQRPDATRSSRTASPAAAPRSTSRPRSR